MGDDLAIQFPKQQGIKFCAVVSGQCWLSVEGVPYPVLLTAGDCFPFPHVLSFRLAADLSLPPVNAASLRAARRAAGAVTDNEVGECHMIAGAFTLPGGHADILLKLLPPIVHIRKESDKAVMRWLLERLREELRDRQAAGSLIAQQLAHMMLVQALGLHLADATTGGVGWLFALADKQMNAAITCMHEDPAHRWTLQELAERVGMSRSIFALRFKATVASTLMEYLTRWRMFLAGDKLKSTDDSISAIAFPLGYESDSAFRRAFRGVMGCSPREFSRGHEAELSPYGEREAAHANQSNPQRNE